MRLLFNVNVAWFFISHRLEIARGARNQGFEVHVAADIESPGEAALLEREGLTFHRVHLTRGGLSPTRDVRYFSRLRAVIKAVRPHVVHNVTVKPVIYGTLAARSLGVTRIVNAVSGLGYAFSGGKSRRLLSGVIKLAYRTALRQPQVRVIFQNADDIEMFTAANIIDRRQVILIRGSGVNLEQFAYEHQSSGTPVIVLPARMLRDKGVVEFANAAKIVRARGIRAEFVLAGMTDPANPASLDKSEIESLERDTGVRWRGHISDMPALYRESHIVCLPSYREGMPKSLLEACAAGRPIVTTDVPGCRDVVRHGENGLLVAPRDVEALAGALGLLVEDSALRKKMGAAGRKRAEAEFDISSVVRATLDVYGSMLS